jgi:hypothetical protein
VSRVNGVYWYFKIILTVSYLDLFCVNLKIWYKLLQSHIDGTPQKYKCITCIWLSKWLKQVRYILNYSRKLFVSLFMLWSDYTGCLYTDSATNNHYHLQHHLFLFKVFEGNSDSYTVKHSYLDEPIIGRFIKFHTVHWNKHPSMRVEIIGCQGIYYLCVTVHIFFIEKSIICIYITLQSILNMYTLCISLSPERCSTSLWQTDSIKWEEL